MTATFDDRLPDFVGIGALKAGTTFLDGLLRNNPQLCLSRGVKEVDYFSVHYRRGPGWYRARFDGCRDRLHGEVSPRYLIDPQVPARIARANPDARLLVVVRDPVERAYSQYKHRLRTTTYSAAFEDYLCTNEGALDRGRYYRHLQTYLEHFPRSALHLLVFDDLVAEPVTAMAGVYGFLGVGSDVVPNRVPLDTNASWQPSRERLYVAAKRLSRGLHDAGFGRMVSLVTASGAGRLLSGDRRPLDAQPMRPDTVGRLRSFYADDVGELGLLVGRDLRGLWWSTTGQTGP